MPDTSYATAENLSIARADGDGPRQICRHNNTTGLNWGQNIHEISRKIAKEITV